MFNVIMKYKRRIRQITVLLILVCCGTVACKTNNSAKSEQGNEGVNDTIPFLNSKIVLATQNEAAKLLRTSDEFTKSLSPFDVSSRLRDKTKTTEKDYLDFASAQAREWSTSDKKNLAKIIASAASKIEELGLFLSLPAEIKILNSTREEENEAAYTRSNYIVMEGDGDEALFLHELFHVYSRANPDKRDELYGTIGFLPNKRILIPESIWETKATNPDAPFMEHYINVMIDGQSSNVTFITQAKEPYSGGSFFEYLEPKLLVLEDMGQAKKPMLQDGKPIIKEYADAKDLFDKIGTNTDYIIHPEEILAMHFTFLTIGEKVPEAKYLDAVSEILRAN